MTIGASHICSVLHSLCKATRPTWFRTWLGATVSATRVSPPLPRAGSTDCFTPPEPWFMLARWSSPLRLRHVTGETAVEDSGWSVCKPVTAKRKYHNIIRAVAYVRGTYRSIQYSFIHSFVYCGEQGPYKTRSLAYVCRRSNQTCPTRWVERLVLVFIKLIKPVLDCLETISEWPDKESSSGANQLLSSLTQPEFLIAMHVVAKVVAVNLGLCRFLHKENIGSGLGR